ncbi:MULTISPECIES: ATP-dependent zinc metalloprotease FtsH [Tenacibaculum]|uniref:ATP-dependent zinc metalloprotease FtsH n=2 Tax=Tenacibaculum TaxID=104267 RepID=A0AAE9SI84_9FLAO|nr:MULTISPECIES: ATP-dependent zinc metalloprotease FtsH [Tenacibaculum]GFD76016.1 ATP-dependent zinc metalloprotease FtsH [Tenacibaculum sp. KUL113]GFD82938.1 ATP-dependent zinc metalloprotease FtsH [Tenacibaculum sp. KUL118]AZJ31144.1 ATP-dependent metallopeptidase FtsH/Yme1/Tma family protein [Tenacibaculum mesophilum]KAF9660194.1 ATP-dependent zinc metalloprotease FtsH [Tenacibaculum mesophilum]MCG7501566.1 ATP-dependent zinc metalloprotease FtsH [Tenacibaculum sp. Mcav3-52]|eukprot:TRINITY_DN6598_c0_g1_i1.p1 TRINITY_DN6598_c0_g1~~TRINITY_DN6598_c0_g1_i1.p1  ORF type:complete len:642 (+),score=174.41 TRINITY_DN6598_c0_g1_i1:955-2880(+)
MSDNKKNAPKFSFNSFWLYIPIIVILLGLSFFNSGNLGSRNITKNEFTKILQANDIKEIVVENNNVAQIFLKPEAEKKEEHKKLADSPFYRKGSPLYTYNFGDLQNFENEINKEKEDKNLDFDKVNVERTSMMDTIISFLPFILLIVIWLFFMRRMSGAAGGGGAGGQIFNIGKSKAKLFDENTKVKTTFKNVAGLEGAKEEVQEIVDFLKSPEKYTKLGGKIPKGALLVGPPGTGKTLLAKAVAGEAGVPFFSLSGSDFVEMFVGVGASRVRDLFKQAQQKSPSIIFIDEIDAIGRARGKNSMTGGNDERENTLNQLLTEMDGFGTDTNVIVLAATNRADVLDKALMRAGRFDRQIYVDLPDLHERREIFEVHIKPLKLAANADLEFLAQQTPGFSGADIANLCNEAALIAARKGKEAIEHQDFLDAVDRIVGGLEKKNKVITPKEKKVIAFHEAGHATVSWMLEHAAPLVKVTIVPRGQSLGAAWYLPEERKIVQTEQMLDEMCATMGGRAAEKLIFNKISTGALSDLEKVTKQARAMVTVYGLNDKVGNVTYYDSSGNDSFVKPYSEATAQKIDEEISEIIENQYKRAVDILDQNRDKLTELADLLLEKEVIFKDDLVKIFGDRPFGKEEKPQITTEE